MLTVLFACLGGPRHLHACGDILLDRPTGNLDGAAFSMTLDGCTGRVTHFLYNGVEQLSASTPLSTLKRNDGQVRFSNAITALGDSQYEVRFQDSSVVTRMRMSPRANRIEFLVTEFANPAAESIRELQFVEFRPARVLERLTVNEVAELTSASVVFALAPRTVEARCNPGASYSCLAAEPLRSDDVNPFINIGATLVVSTFGRYYDAFEQYVRETNFLASGARDPACTLPNGDPNPTCLPYPVFADGRWLRKSTQVRESYLFANIRSNEEGQTFSSLLLEGHIPQMLLLDPLVYGMYHEPKNFECATPGNCYDAFKTSMRNNFINKGIRIGVHTFPNVLDASSKTLLNLADPRNDPHNPAHLPLHALVYSRRIGTLVNGIAASGNSNIQVDNNLSQNATFQFYYGQSYFGEDGQKFIVDDELFVCRSGYDGAVMYNCERPIMGTRAAAHAAGTGVYLAPELLGLFINGPRDTDGTEPSPLSRISTESFCNTLTEIGASFVYLDGVPFLPIPGITQPSTSDDTRTAFAKYGWMPYFNKCQQLNNGTLPLLVESGYSSFHTYYAARSASDDGVTFQTKNNTKYRVNQYFALRNPFYEPVAFDMGWWKLNGAQMQGKVGYQLDIDATTFDDADYLMTKAVAYDAAVGIQLHPTYGSNRRLRELLHRVGLYHQLQAKVDQGQITIPSGIVSRLRIIDQEAEIHHPEEHLLDPQYVTDPVNAPKKYRTLSGPGFNFVRKQVYRKQLSEDDNTLAFTNPYGPQRLRLELRARPSFYPMSDTSHHIRVSPASMSRNLFAYGMQCPSSAGGVMNISNTSTTIGGCRYAAGNHALMNRRGFGIRLRHTPGTNGYDGQLMVRVEGTVGIRDFKLPLNFAGERVVTLSEAATEAEENGSNHLWDGVNLPKLRHWEVNYGRSTTVGGQTVIAPMPVYLYVNNVMPGKSLSLEILEFLILDERADLSPLRNPMITVNGNSIRFPATLQVDDQNPYILEFDGYGHTFQTLTSGLWTRGDGCTQCVDPTLTEDPIEVAGGTYAQPGYNELILTADPGGSQRAEVTVTVMDDEDGDGIPTQGDFGGTPGGYCTGTNDFCNDPCPNFHNPTLSTCSDNTPPVVTITAPTGTHTSRTVTIQATANDNVALQSLSIELDGEIIARCPSSPCTASWNTSLSADELHTIRAVAEDRSIPANVGAAMRTITVDNVAPTVAAFTLTPPPPGGVVTGLVSLSSTASDNAGGSGLLRVDFLDGSTLLGSTSAAAGAYLWNSASVVDGPHTLWAIAYDRQGNASAAFPLEISVFNPLGIISWASLRVHGTSGELPIVLKPAASGNGASGATVEPRSNGLQKLRVEFNKPIALVNAAGFTTVGRTPSGGQMGPPISYSPRTLTVLNGNLLVASFTPASGSGSTLPDGTCFTFTVTPGTVLGLQGELLTGDVDANARTLTGDCTGDGDVTLGDTLSARAAIGTPVTGAPSRDDNCSGNKIDLGDALFIKSRIGRIAKLVCP